QHYHAIKAWGGEAGLRALQERDRRKAALCDDMGITLIEVNYTEPLSEGHVARRLGEATRKDGDNVVRNP
ncbi:MAG: hypothetical protein ABIH46_09595, partial [Chloroflexota bacterium]